MRRAWILLAALAAGCATGDDASPPGAADAGVEAGPLAVAITSPAEGAPVPDRFVTVSGTATGPVERVEIRIDDGPPIAAAGRTAWQATVALDPGARRLTVAAHGPGDAVAEAARTLYVGRTVRLVAPAGGDPGEIELRLDRLGLQRVLRPEDQRQIVLAYLDLAPLVRNALAALADPDAWGVDSAAWGPAERNLARLLTMDPDRADVSGSALAPLLDLSARLGLPPPRVFADLLAIEPTEPILDRDVVAGALLDQVIRSHPAFDGDDEGRLAVTLEDALSDLATFAERYGPAGDHPGFVAAPPRAELFTPAFAMVVRGRGNVRILPGVRPGAGYASHVVPPVEGAPILDLDFEDPERFRVEGLEPEPRVALTLEVAEAEAFFEIGPPDAPPPRGGSAVWSAPPWSLERVVAEASFRAFAGRFAGERVLTYDLGAISPAATLVWRGGFVTVDVVGDLGPPPPPAYIWDLMLDVAQRRLHDGDLEEGSVRARLALPPLPIGLDAEGLVEAMRPLLQAQRAELVALMLGEPESLESRATLWLDARAPALRVADGAPPLHARADLSDAPRDVAPLGDAPAVWWTRSPEGERYAVLVGPWRGDAVDVGLVAVPEASEVD